MSSTGNIRGQRTQSSANGYKTLASSIASGNNGGCFKRIYINAFERYNGNSELALSSTLGINKGDYAHTNSQALTTFKSASYPKVTNYKNAGFVHTPSGAKSLSSVHTTSTMMGSTPSSTPNTISFNSFQDFATSTYFSGLVPTNAIYIKPFANNLTYHQFIPTSGSPIFNFPSNCTINISNSEVVQFHLLYSDEKGYAPLVTIICPQSTTFTFNDSSTGASSTGALQIDYDSLSVNNTTSTFSIPSNWSTLTNFSTISTQWQYNPI